MQLDCIEVASKVPEMNSLGSQGQQIGNGSIGVKADKLRLQFAVLWVLPKLCHFIILHLTNGLSCLNLLLKLVLLEGAACGLGFKVEQVADHHDQTDHQWVALKWNEVRGREGGREGGGGKSMGHQSANMHILPNILLGPLIISAVYTSPGTILYLYPAVKLLQAAYCSYMIFPLCHTSRECNRAQQVFTAEEIAINTTIDTNHKRHNIINHCLQTCLYLLLPLPLTKWMGKEEGDHSNRWENCTQPEILGKHLVLNQTECVAWKYSIHRDSCRALI